MEYAKLNTDAMRNPSSFVEFAARLYCCSELNSRNECEDVQCGLWWAFGLLLAVFLIVGLIAGSIMWSQATIGIYKDVCFMEACETPRIALIRSPTFDMATIRVVKECKVGTLITCYAQNPDNVDESRRNNTGQLRIHRPYGTEAVVLNVIGWTAGALLLAWAVIVIVAHRMEHCRLAHNKAVDDAIQAKKPKRSQEAARAMAMDNDPV